MAFELAAARILAPTVGSSTYVWTSVIGVIIAALSLGYYAGGRIADKRRQEFDVALLLLGASFAVISCLVLYSEVLAEIASWSVDVRFQAVLAAGLLFAPASFVLGMVSPYLVKLNIQSLKQSGSAVADLSALNSIGGIIGTFVTGFVLFGYIGARETIMIVTLLLLACSWLFVVRVRAMRRMLFSCVVIILMLLSGNSPVLAIDTASAHYEIKEQPYGISSIRGISTGPRGIQSAVYINGSSELVFWYTQQMAMLTVAQTPKDILILGGGTFTLPRALAERLPESTIDVVEIDPKLQQIAEEHFFYTNPSNVSVITADARSYVNQTTKQYDVVLVDVYGDAEIPFSLMTREYGEAVKQATKPEGVVIVNIIGGATGACREVLDTVASGYAAQFSHAQYQPNPSDTPSYTNIIAVFSDVGLGYGTAFGPLPHPYTDNYTPSERLFHQCQQSV